MRMPLYRRGKRIVIVSHRKIVSMMVYLKKRKKFNKRKWKGN